MYSATKAGLMLLTWSAELLMRDEITADEKS